MAIKKNSISNFILLVLEKSIDGYSRFEDFTYHHYRYRWGIPELKKSALSQALRRLRLNGYIEKNFQEGRVVYKLSELGADALGIDNVPWDGKWRIVMFDIPENKRVIRDSFRRKLKEWKFKRWQQSVWITQKNITEKLRKLIDSLEITQWVAVIESNDQALHYMKFNGRGT